MITRRSFTAGSAALALSVGVCSRVLGNSVSSDDRLIYGYPPGASGSKLANMLLPLLAAQGGPTYHLTNIEGRNTRAASVAAARATPDGTVMLQAISASLTLMPSLYKNMGFDPLRDFKPIANVADFPYILVVGPVVPNTVTNVGQYLSWVENNPDFRNIGISIHGSVGELAVRTMANATGTSFRSQAYQQTDDMLADLRSQSLAAAFIVPSRGISQELNAPVRPIAVTSAERFSYWPNVVPLAEQGFSGLNLSAWFGWFTQASTPESALIQLRAAVLKLQASQGYADTLKSLLLSPNPLSADRITARMNEEVSSYRLLVDKLRIPKLD